MEKFPEWVDSLKELYEEDADCEVLRADIKMVMKKPNGEIIVRCSEYEDKVISEIELDETSQGSVSICGIMVGKN